jgi:hypothetical protein
MKKNNEISILEIKDKQMNQRRKLLLGVGATSAIAVWHKPIVNAIILPAHAQTSNPAAVCPMIVLGNTVTGPVSGSNTPPVCSVTFDVLSATAVTSLTITGITTTALPADTTVTFDSLGQATDLAGPRITWRGPAAGAPFCLPFTPVDSVTFTITATCAAAGGGTFSQDFTLASLL